MKKIFAVAAITGLIALGACHKTPTNDAENAALANSEMLENQADAYDNLSEATNSDAVAAAADNAGDAAEMAADNAQAAVDNGSLANQ